jgi:prevent-host-death family protein
MTTMKISLRKAREHFSEIVNLVDIKGERIILTSRNRPKVAIVSLKDMEILESRTIRKERRYNQLQKISEVRKRLAKHGATDGALEELEKIREERIGALTGRR